MVVKADEIRNKTTGLNNLLIDNEKVIEFKIDNNNSSKNDTSFCFVKIIALTDKGNVFKIGLGTAYGGSDR